MATRASAGRNIIRHFNACANLQAKAQKAKVTKYQPVHSSEKIPPPKTKVTVHPSSNLSSPSTQSRASPPHRPPSPLVQPPPPPPSNPRSKRPLYIVAALAVYATTGYLTYLYIQYRKAVKINHEHELLHNVVRETDVDVSKVYDRISGQYDGLVNGSEMLMGMGWLRSGVCKELKGDVLEVSAGTGRNLKYLPVTRCTSITLLDSSQGMLLQARKHFRELYPVFDNVNYLVKDGAEPIPSPANKGFDYVFQTMGVCSTHDPVKLLKNLEHHCKDGGKIILLEHGRSHYDWLNNILDAYAPDHAENWGCWWNRDIGKIVEDSGLKVDKIIRYHLGTTWKIEASKRKSS